MFRACDTVDRLLEEGLYDPKAALLSLPKWHDVVKKHGYRITVSAREQFPDVAHKNLTLTNLFGVGHVAISVDVIPEGDRFAIQSAAIRYPGDGSSHHLTQQTVAWFRTGLDQLDSILTRFEKMAKLTNVRDLENAFYELERLREAIDPKSQLFKYLDWHSLLDGLGFEHYRKAYPDIGVDGMHLVVLWTETTGYDVSVIRQTSRGIFFGTFDIIVWSIDVNLQDTRQVWHELVKWKDLRKAVENVLGVLHQHRTRFPAVDRADTEREQSNLMLIRLALDKALEGMKFDRSSVHLGEAGFDPKRALLSLGPFTYSVEREPDSLVWNLRILFRGAEAGKLRSAATQEEVERLAKTWVKYYNRVHRRVPFDPEKFETVWDWLGRRAMPGRRVSERLDSKKMVLALPPPYRYIVNWRDNYNQYYKTKPLPTLEKALQFAYTSSLFNKASEVYIEEYPYGDPFKLLRRLTLNQNYEIESEQRFHEFDEMRSADIRQALVEAVDAKAALLGLPSWRQQLEATGFTSFAPKEPVGTVYRDSYVKVYASGVKGSPVTNIRVYAWLDKDSTQLVFQFGERGSDILVNRVQLEAFLKALDPAMARWYAHASEKNIWWWDFWKFREFLEDELAKVGGRMHVVEAIDPKEFVFQYTDLRQMLRRVGYKPTAGSEFELSKLIRLYRDGSGWGKVDAIFRPGEVEVRCSFVGTTQTNKPTSAIRLRKELYTTPLAVVIGQLAREDVLLDNFVQRLLRCEQVFRAYYEDVDFVKMGAELRHTLTSESGNPYVQGKVRKFVEAAGFDPKQFVFQTTDLASFLRSLGFAPRQQRWITHYRQQRVIWVWKTEWPHQTPPQPYFTLHAERVNDFRQQPSMMVTFVFEHGAETQEGTTVVLNGYGQIFEHLPAIQSIVKKEARKRTVFGEVSQALHRRYGNESVSLGQKNALLADVRRPELMPEGS